MKILIVGLVKNPQLERVKEEGEKRGHVVEGCYVKDIIIYSDINTFLPTLLNRSLDEYDLLYLWTVGKKRWEWYVASYYLNEVNKTIIVNYKVVNPSYKLYLSPGMNYYKQYKEKILQPKSAILFTEASALSVLDKFSFPLILKTSRGRQGKGVFKVDNKEELVKLARELEEDKVSFILREFIPNDGDIRVFTVGYKAIGAMKRTPPKGDFRSNISQGGRGESFDLGSNPAVQEIAERMSELTGTEVAGVDIMLHKETGDPYVLEVNPGPQFTGFEKYTGTNAAEEIVKYFEKLYDNRSRKVK